MRAAAVVRHRASSPKVLDRVLAETHARKFTVSQSVSQSVISRSRTALTPPPARSPAPPLPALTQVPSTRSRGLLNCRQVRSISPSANSGGDPEEDHRDEDAPFIKDALKATGRG